jgi:hypothetical protein
VAAIRVRSNREVHGDADVALPSIAPHATETFDVALVPGPACASAEWTALHSRRHALVWLEGVDAAQADAFRAAAVALLDGQTGNNDNARKAGRDGLAAAGLPTSREDAAAAGVRALVLFLHDQHGKVAFWTCGWPPACQLNPRGERGGNLQVFDEGGELWLKPGGRAVFLGALPLQGPAPKGLGDLPAAWSGGKASALYDLLRQHEDAHGSQALVEGIVRAAHTDAAHPDEAPAGLAVVTRTEP